jgi:hypothetical protein
MPAYLTVPSAPQSSPASFLSVPGAEAIYGCVDWFFYQSPDPEEALAGTESALNPADAGLAVSY